MSLDWRRWLGWGPAREFALSDARWVVVDVETTGLDVHRDRLLAIGAIGVTGNRLVPRDSFEVVLQQGQASSADNILVHRITGTEQRGGEAPDRALDAFMQFAGRAGTAGCVGYHAAFDEAMIKRACKNHRRTLPATLMFLDLADLAPALLPEMLPAKAPLDSWLAHFGIRISRRHHAVADALGTAQLFLHLRALALAQGLNTSAKMFELARAQRWLDRSA